MKVRKIAVLIAAILGLLTCLSGSAFKEIPKAETTTVKATAVNTDIDYDDFGGGDYACQEYGNTRYIPQGSNLYGILIECVSTTLDYYEIHKDTKIIDNYAFLGCREMKSVVIPAGVTSIGDGVFEACDLLQDVFYRGTKAQWDSIPKGEDYINQQKATIHYCDANGACSQCDASCATIVRQPTNAYALEGETARVSLKAGGEGLSYQWYYKNLGEEEFSLTTTFTSSSYSTKMNDQRKGRQIYCVVTDKYGNKAVTNVVTLYEGTDAAILKQPANALALKGKEAKVTIQAEGDGLSYKWYYKNKGASKFSLTTSFKGSSYSVEMNTDRNGRQIYCVVTDKYGNQVKSNTVTLSLKTVAKIIKQPANALALKGKVAKVTVQAEGDGLSYKWYYKNKGASKFSLTTSFKGSSYSVQMNGDRSGRKVYCVITDKYGNKVTTKTVTLTLKTVAKITSSPASVTVKKGSTAKFTVKAVGDGIGYQWQVKTPDGTWKNTTTAGNKTKTVKVSATQARNGYRYRCVVTDKYGNRVFSSAAVLKVK